MGPVFVPGGDIERAACQISLPFLPPTSFSFLLVLDFSQTITDHLVTHIKFTVVKQEMKNKLTSYKEEKTE